ncbi:MAG: hypothetical protein JWM10_5158 [Myxococcaceae bacterium]|nr:hypothetical protein [Myxococcaceae bacterium]
MTAPPEVTLDAATEADAAVLANLIELYAHDLSATFALELRPDGRYGYDALPRYWSEPDGRFAFLIRCDGQLAGFALVTRGSPGNDDPEVFDVAEFFVVRRHRRAGVGQRAAALIWNHFPVRWNVRVSEGTPGGPEFWARAIATYTDNEVIESVRPGRLHPWRVFAFDGGHRR